MVRWRRPPWVAPTSHGAWLLVVAVALVAGGVLWGVRLVRDAGLLLACLAATSFAAASAGAVVHAVALARRRPRPVGPTHVEAGETARWSLTTDRPGASLPAWVLWRAPEGRWLRALVEGRSDLLLALPRRGSYQIRADGLTFTDPLGLWRVRVPLGEGATVVVLPRPVPVVRSPPGTQTTSSSAPPRPSGRTTAGTWCARAPPSGSVRSLSGWSSRAPSS